MSQSHMSSADWDLMKWGRLGSYRQPVAWGSVDRGGERPFRWDELDGVVESAARRDIDLLPVLYSSPGWLTSDRRRLPVWGKRPIGEWKEFVKKVVLRYGTDGTFWSDNPEVPVRQVERWQIWNEPNIKFYAHPVSAKLYARLLKISARVIRKFDPDAEIVTAGFYASPPDGKGIDAGLFLKRMYRIRGVRSSFDVAAIHPYGSTTKQTLERTNPIRRIMNRNGNRKRRMLITEIGWGSDFATVFGTGSERGQAIQLDSAYRKFLANRKRLKLDAVYWYAWNDLPESVKACAFCYQTGLFDPQGDAKAAWYSLLRYTHDI